VLDRQPEQVRRLLLRTSILERVNGELVGLLTGNSGGERVLQDLEAANAFVVAVDAGRSWFRYHHLFADLLARRNPGRTRGPARIQPATTTPPLTYPTQPPRHWRIRTAP